MVGHCDLNEPEEDCADQEMSDMHADGICTFLWTAFDIADCSYILLCFMHPELLPDSSGIDVVEDGDRNDDEDVGSEVEGEDGGNLQTHSAPFNCCMLIF